MDLWIVLTSEIPKKYMHVYLSLSPHLHPQVKQRKFANLRDFSSFLHLIHRFIITTTFSSPLI